MVNYTNYQQRALYGAGQAASRAGQRFHMERDALQRGDKAAAKYHRSRANALNRQGAYAAVRGMGGNEGANRYFPVTSSGQPITGKDGGIGLTLSTAGRDIFDKFRQQGFVKPIREKKRYAPNTEPRGLGWLLDQGMKNTLFAKMVSSMAPKKAPKPDDAYYKSLWGKGLNEMYSPSGIFSSGDFLGEADIDPYYRKRSLPKGLGFLKPFIRPRSDAFGVVRDSNIPEDWEFMQETPIDYSGFMEPELNLSGSGDEMTEDDYTYKGEFPGDTQGNVDSGYYNIGPSSYMDDLTEKIVEEGVNEDTIEKTFSTPELQEAKFDWGNLGTDEYSPWMDLNITQIQNPAKRDAAKNAAIRFNMAWKQGNTEDYELEELYQDYLDAVEAGKRNRIDQ